MNYDHAGMGWPNMAADNAKILALPSRQLLMLNSEHWHYDNNLAAGKEVLWRGVPRPGKRPAELKYDDRKFAEECRLHIGDEGAKKPVVNFVGWNELNLQDERGDHEDDNDPSLWQDRYHKLGIFLADVVTRLKSGSTRDADIHFGAWAPGKGEIEFLSLWRQAALACNVVDFHAYDSLDNIKGAYDTYRSIFPGKRLALTEWHCKGNLSEEKKVLQWLRNTMDGDPLFEAAYFFIWEWDNAPGWWSQDYDVANNPNRYDLFLRGGMPFDAPVQPNEPEPQPEEPVVPTVNPWEFFTAEAIVEATQCPIDAVRINWPKLVEQLVHCNINEKMVQIGMIGTIAIESASTFEPVREAYFLGDAAEQHRRGLSYYPYYGRGYIQLTHRGNYAAYTVKLAQLWGTPVVPELDMEANPDIALDSDISAGVSALYFRDTATLQGYSIVQACRSQDWEWVRRLVYGGPDAAGTSRISSIANRLLGTFVPVKVQYNALEPAHPQNEDYDCSQDSLEWALWSLGRKPEDGWMTRTMVEENVMSSQQGLLDATGKGLADFVIRHYGEDGFDASNAPVVSFMDVALEGEHWYPLLIGGRAWNHWSGVRGYDAASGLLILANPADGYKGVGQTMTEQQFNQLGPFSMVRVVHPDLLEGVTPEPEPPTPQPTRAREIAGQIEALAVELKGLV